MKTEQSGVILITTLWILLILSVMALGISIELHLEAKLARYQVDSHTAYYLAKAGVERAMVELKNDAMLDHKARPQIYDALGDSWNLNEDTKKIFENVEVGEGTYTVKVVDEYSKVNINKASAKMLEGLFRALDFDEDEAKIFAVSIVDFRDTDTTYLLDTTLSEGEFYYPNEDTTTSNTHFKNADFLSPEELLQIPGFTPDMLYTPRTIHGDEENKVALIDLLTIQGDGIINVNTAPLPCLTALVIGIGEEDVDEAVTLAEKIIEHRNGPDDEEGTDDDQPYVSPGEVSNELGPLNPVLASRISSSLRTNSDLFLITSTGEVSGAKKRVQALVHREWVTTLLSEEEKHDIEKETTGIKEGVKLQVRRWIEF